MHIRYPFAAAFGALVLLFGYGLMTPMPISGVNDKLLHFSVFFLMTLALYWIVDLPRRLLLKLVLGGMAAFAVGSEFLQSALANGRQFDVVDIAANFMGAAFALSLCAWYHRRMLERKRARKLGRYGPIPETEGEDLELGESSRSQEMGVIEEEDEDNEAWDDLDGNKQPEANGNHEPVKESVD